MTNAPEPDRQLGHLLTDVGLPGSGGVRYAAAMYFYMRREMTAEMLEIYRCCSKFDAEDPLEIARHEGVCVPPLLQENRTETR